MITEFILAALISQAALFYTGMPEKFFPPISALLFSYNDPRKIKIINKSRRHAGCGRMEEL